MRRNILVTVIAVVLVAIAILMYVHQFNNGSKGSGISIYTPNTGININPAPITTTSSTIRLSTLNGTVVSLGGEEITEQLWTRMKDYDASDPAIAEYIEWLRKALAPNPGDALNVPWYPRYRYWWFNDRYGWSVPLPDEDSVVKVGLVKLPFGAGLIVTAYPSKDGITIVVHGTIINKTEWRELVARAFAGSYFNYRYSDDPNVTVKWVLWRIMLVGHGSKLKVDGGEIPVKRVVVLLEMPTYYLTFDQYHVNQYSTYLEGFYWDVIGHPALALAIHLAYPSNTDIIRLYSNLVKDLTWRVVLTDVEPSWEKNGWGTPFGVRVSGGYVCTSASGSTSLFASNALGAFTAYIAVPGHAISILMYPSNPVLDIDKDNRAESLIIVDTAHYSIEYIETHIESVNPMPPLLYGENDNLYNVSVTIKVWEGLAGKYPYIYAGIPDAVLELPRWLKAPWLEYAMEKSNFTHYVDMAWRDKGRVCVYQKYLTGWMEWVDETMTEPLYTVPPGVALALGKVMNNLPVVYGASTPPIRWMNLTCGAKVSIVLEKSGDRYVGSVVVNGENITVIGTNATYLPSGDLVMQITVYVNGVQAYSGEMKFICGLFGCEAEPIVAYGEKGAYELWISAAGDSNGGGSGSDSGSGNSSGGCNNTSGGSEGSSGEETSTINATIQLLPIYTSEETPWGEMPVLDRLRGTSVVDNTNITVEAFYTGDGYDIYVYVNSGYAYGTYTNLPATIEFTYNNTEYRIEVKPPAPPALNQTIELELVPVDETQVALPNGTVINVTVYMVNQTITINNATLVVFGYISRLGTDLDIYVFGVPPAEYNITIEGLDATIEADYSGALHIYIHYQAPENQLIPINTTVEIAIQPLGLGVELIIS